MAEQRFCKPQVGGSIPLASSTFFNAQVLPGNRVGTSYSKLFGQQSSIPSVEPRGVLTAQRSAVSPDCCNTPVLASGRETAVRSVLTVEQHVTASIQKKIVSVWDNRHVNTRRLG